MKKDAIYEGKSLDVQQKLYKRKTAHPAPLCYPLG